MHHSEEFGAARPDDPLPIGRAELADGGVVLFRHVRPEDESLITDAIRTASRETRLHRFFSPIRAVSPDRLRQMLQIDRSRELCIVGSVNEAGRERLICGARFVRLQRPGSAEIALTVHDDYQRRGLGTALLTLLVRLAREEGIDTFEADVMASNSGMLRLLQNMFPQHVRMHSAGDIYHVRIPLEK